MSKRKGGAASPKGWTTYELRGRTLSKNAKPITRIGQSKKKTSDLWRRPVDLTPDMARRLLHGLADNHLRRLAVLVRQGGRAKVTELLAVTGDRDLRVLSYFQGALSRKIRRLAGDREKRLHLIGWDFASTEWNDDHTVIVDGDCYITDASVAVLRDALGAVTANDRGAKRT